MVASRKTDRALESAGRAQRREVQEWMCVCFSDFTTQKQKTNAMKKLIRHITNRRLREKIKKNGFFIWQLETSKRMILPNKIGMSIVRAMWRDVVRQKIIIATFENKVLFGSSHLSIFINKTEFPYAEGIAKWESIVDPQNVIKDEEEILEICKEIKTFNFKIRK